MSKNLTRKGLVLGTVAALGASLFAGTPATAAPTALYLDTAFGTSGTSQTGVLGQWFTLASSNLGGTSSDTVKYFVEGATAANVSFVGRYTTDLSASGSTAYSASASATAVDNDAKTAVISGGTLTAGNYYELAVKLNSTNITSTTSLKVTPFLDSVIADNKPGANELTGPTVTINFVKGSELTATPTLTAVTGGKATATVAVSGGVNLAQFRTTAKGGQGTTPFTVDFKETGADWSGNTAQNVFWNTTDSVLSVDSSNNTTAGNVYGATAKIDGTASASATAVTATAGEVASLAAATIKAGSSYRATRTGSTSNVVRAGSGSITAKTTVTAVSGKSKAGQKVTFVISENGAATLPTGATITAGGKTLTIAKTADVESLSVDVTSAADGTAVLPIAYTGITDSKTFNVYAKATSASGTVYDGAQTASDIAANTVALVLTGQDSVAVSLVDSIKSANATAVRRVARAGSYSIALQAVDQFGQVPSGTFRVVVSNDGSGTHTTSHGSPLAVSNGQVTVTGTDTSTADGSYNVTAQLQKLGTDGSTYTDVSGISSAAAISVGAVAAGTTVTLTPSTLTGRARNGAALVAGNSNLEQTTVARTVAGDATLSAVVTDAAGATVAGTDVTFSAPGVLFNAGSVYGLGSITVRTTSAGATGTVNLYSNAVGDVVVTVASGSGSATKTFTFATPTTGGSAWNVTAPTNVLPGTTLKVSGVLVDDFGGKVDTAATVGSSVKPVKVVYTGPGYVTSTIATETDADGSVAFTVLLGAGDTGTATVKFIYSGANDTIEETTLNDDIVKTVTITIGAAAPAVATSANASASTGKINVAVTAAAGKTVVVKVGGKFATSFSATGAKKTVAVKSAKGAKVVTIYVGGKLVKTVKVTVK